MRTAELPVLEMSRARILADEALIRLLIQYHDAHVRDLAMAVELAQSVAGAHEGWTAFPQSLPRQLAEMLEDLRGHQAREEAVLFPVILGGRGDTLRYPIAALGTEHDTAQERLERLVLLTADFTPPRDASAAWIRLYDLCRKFDREFREHVQLEERVLFPRFL